MLKVSCVAISICLSFICCSNSFGSTIDLNSFQKPNIRDFKLTEFVQHLNKEVESKQRAASAINQTDPIVEGKSLDWLNALEKGSQNFLHETIFNSPFEESDLYVFASLGLKKKHLKALVEDAKRFGGRVVIRGLKNGSFKDTISYLNSILQKEHEGVQIDPTLFRKYNVISVPAFVLLNENQYDIVRGNVTARFALSKMRAHGDLSTQANERLGYAK